MELTSSQIKNAFAVLEKEQEANLLTRRRKFIILILNITVFGFILIPLLWFLMEKYFKINLEKYSDIIFSLIGILLVLIILFFLFSLPLIFKFWRFNRLVRRLGLNKTISAPWKKAKRKAHIRNILVLIIAWIGAGLIIYGLYIVFFGSGGLLLRTDYIILGLFICLIGLSFLSIHFIRRNKYKLQVIEQLQSNLTKYKDVLEEKSEDTKYKIPQEDYDLIAKIEKAQISRDQTQSIMENLNEQTSSYYSIQKSREFRETLNQLDANIRLAVEDHIDDLAININSSSAQKKQQLDTLNLSVPGNPVQISYQIDDNKNQIKLISLKQVKSE